MAGAETFHVDDIVRRVGAKHAVRVIRALGHRILVTGWHGWSRWRGRLGAIGRIIIGGMISLVAVVGRTRIILVVRLGRIRAVRTVGLGINGQWLASHRSENQCRQADQFHFQHIHLAVRGFG